MTLDQKLGQIACVSNVDRALLDLQRAVLITGLGRSEVNEIQIQLARLLSLTNRAKVTEAQSPIANRQSAIS
jgi:hypothetical protein